MSQKEVMKSNVKINQLAVSHNKLTTLVACLLNEIKGLKKELNDYRGVPDSVPVSSHHPSKSSQPSRNSQPQPALSHQQPMYAPPPHQPMYSQPPPQQGMYGQPPYPPQNYQQPPYQMDPQYQQYLYSLNNGGYKPPAQPVQQQNARGATQSASVEKPGKGATSTNQFQNFNELNADEILQQLSINTTD